MNPRDLPGFPYTLLVRAPLAASALAGVLWGALVNDLFVDLIANWLAVPCLIVLGGIALLQLVAVPLGIYRAGRAGALRRAGVWLALLCGSGFFAFVAYIGAVGLYAA